MARSTYNDRNNNNPNRFREVLITKESWDGFPNKHLFNDYKLAWFTEKLANKAIDYINDNAERLTIIDN